MNPLYKNIQRLNRCLSEKMLITVEGANFLNFNNRIENGGKIIGFIGNGTPVPFKVRQRVARASDFRQYMTSSANHYFKT